MKNFFASAIVLITFLFSFQYSNATLPDSCKLNIGTNLSGIVDWSSEIPFVDMMKFARTWGTQNISWVANGNNPWDSQVIDSIPKNLQGYPTQIPFYKSGLGLDTSQCVYTVWAENESWTAGTYVFLYDGEGTFDFSFDANEISVAPGKIEVNVTPAISYIIQLKILSSNPDNPARNFRFLIPGTEFTYQTQPFNQQWIDRLQPFSTLRFMDWGSTNNWGFNNGWEVYNDDADSVKVEWTAKPQDDYFTYATNKGVPYQVMIDACNLLHKNMWICVPHNASDDYITQLATLVKNNLDPSLKIYVEYSNEIWNWGFGQGQWLYKFGCVNKNKTWPEGIVPYIQNCMDIWSNVFASDMNRIVRVVGVQAAWQDVANRVVFNMVPGSFDAFAPAAYFGIGSGGDAALDALGAAASVSDVVSYTNIGIQESFDWLQNQKTSIADSLHVPMMFYEGGQGIVPEPFGVEPTYSQALLDIQRDPVIYDLYQQWFDSLRSFNDSDDPMLFMNFSFVTQRSAKYGSWGILEYINQDTAVIPSPKYQAVLDNIFSGCNNFPTGANEITGNQNQWSVYPNPVASILYLSKNNFSDFKITDELGRIMLKGNEKQVDVSSLAPGIYFIQSGNNVEKFIRE